MGKTTETSKKELTILREEVREFKKRAKTFVRPLRRYYIHLLCGGATQLGDAVAEMWAANHQCLGGAHCQRCRDGFPLVNAQGLRAFIWEDGTGVGT